MAEKDDDAAPGGDADKPNSSGAPFPIVGIGASAGGIHALQAFFESLPDHVDAAFVVIVHLAPKSQSDLAGILGIRTHMPVTQVEDTAPLEPNHVYVIPPDRRLRIADNHVAAVRFDEPRGQRAPIDLFFRSLAEQPGDSFAIILTGAGSDGAIGVRAVKEAGGIVLVQDPNEAEYPSMPRSAIATGVADFVLPVHDMAARLLALMKNKDDRSVDPTRDADDEYVGRILDHVRARTGHDFSRYKRSTVLRRIARRMQVTRREDMADYYSYLRDHGDEAEALFADLLISVTTFFRDEKAFAALAQHAIPQLFEGKTAKDTIRVWIPGCATGEEAYTIAILLMEEAARRDDRPQILVFGSDLDVNSIAIARNGLYPEAVAADLDEKRLGRFFSREGDHYRVNHELRDAVIFANHSLLRDPPFSRLDLVSCRNLLIYLDRELQQQVIATFHYAMNPNGFLLLGASESADHPDRLFSVVEHDARLYQSTGVVGDRLPLPPRLLGIRIGGEPAAALPRIVPSGARNEPAVHRLALETDAPPSILVDSAGRAIHLSETAGRFLQPPGGLLTRDVADLVRPELRLDLRAALHRAFERNEATLSAPLAVRFNGAPHRVYLQVKPVREDPDRPPHHALVMFIEGEAIQPPAADAPIGTDQHPVDGTVRKLEEELQLAQSNLRMTREDSEATTEELRAANEELQSINEEYRSTSEELETSKEELQSVNEELQTVNSELKLKLDAISRAHSDLQNLMAATDVGTLFLDPSLRIKRFTARATDLFNITPHDEGRPITDFTHQLDYEDLANDARAVLKNLVPIEREIKSRDRRWHLIRLRPYRTVDDKIDGVVITIIDITARRQMEDALRDSEQRLLHESWLVELSRAPIFVWDMDGGIVQWNRGSEQLYGYSREMALGKRQDSLLGTSVPGSSFEQLKRALLENEHWSGELHHTTKDGRKLTVETEIRLVSMDGHRLALESTHDVTERKAWETRLHSLLGELSSCLMNTLTAVQSVAGQTLRGSATDQEFINRFNGYIGALARAYRLLLDSNWQGTDIGALIRDQLAPYVSGNPGRARLDGDSVVLSADVALPFGLLLHELATNAAKHGALKVAKGTVNLKWSVIARNGRRTLSVTWEERGGPHVTKPATVSLASRLIAKGLPHAEVLYEWRRQGIVCMIDVPLSEAATGKIGG